MAIAIAHSPGEWTAKFGAQPKPATVVAIGNFDGVHLGHQKILNGVLHRAHADNFMPAVLTFYPHPAHVLRPGQAPPLLMTVERRLAAIESLEIDAALVARFDVELAKVGPEEFVKSFLVDTMNARCVLVGANFRFGHRQSGDAKLLAELGASMGFNVEIVEPVVEGGTLVSSTAIRQALQGGRVEQARQMLGAPYALEGQIQPGTGQGRKLVVPTFNLATRQELLPAYGVYATEALVNGKAYKAATNIGMRPTFDGSHVSVESHLLDFTQNLTQGNLEIRFWWRLRDERKFSGPAALREQVLKDIDQAREYFRESKLGAR